MTKQKKEPLRTFNIEISGKGRPKKVKVQGLTTEAYSISDFGIIFKVLSYDKAVVYSAILNVEAILTYTVTEPKKSKIEIVENKTIVMIPQAKKEVAGE